MTDVAIKLVSVLDGIRSSLIAMDEESDVIYHNNEWASPVDNYGPLCTFATEEEALHFMSQQGFIMNRHTEMWECEIKRSLHMKVWDYNTDPKDEDTVLNDLPNGTILADQVKLIRRLEKWDAKS